MIVEGRGGGGGGGGSPSGSSLAHSVSLSLSPTSGSFYVSLYTPHLLCHCHVCRPLTLTGLGHHRRSGEPHASYWDSKTEDNSPNYRFFHEVMRCCYSETSAGVPGIS